MKQTKTRCAPAKRLNPALIPPPHIHTFQSKPPLSRIPSLPVPWLQCWPGKQLSSITSFPVMQVGGEVRNLQYLT